MARAGGTHDITIKGLSDGTATGFMLARDKNGSPIWTVSPYKAVPPRILSDAEYQYAQFPPEVAATWHETSWHHGLGGLGRQDNDNQSIFKFGDGFKVDISEAGVAKLARACPASTVDLAPGQYRPSGFARSGGQMWAGIGDYLYSWDFTNKRWKRQSQYPSSDSDRIFRNGIEFGGSVYMPSWANDAGSTIPTPNIPSSADEPQRYIYKTLGASTWTEASHSTTEPAFCKFLTVANSKLVMGYIGDQVDTTCDLILDITAADGEGGAYWPTNSLSATTGLAVGDVIRIEDELMLVTAVDTPNRRIAAERGYRGTLAVAHTATKDIYEVTLNKHQIRTRAEGGLWSSPTNVGDASSAIVGMLGVDWDAASYIYIFKTDGVYNYDFTDVNKVSNIGGPTNGRANCLWNGHVYFSKAGGGLYELDPDTDNIIDVSFSIVLPSLTYLHGEVVALHAFPDSLYALVHDSANSKYHLLEGRAVEGNAQISWQHVAAFSYVTGTATNHAALWPDTTPNGNSARERLQVGVESTGSNLLPYHYLRPLDEDTYYNDADDSYMVFIKQDWGLTAETKRMSNLKVTTENLGSGGTDHYMEFQYRVDGGAWAWFASTVGGTASQAASKVTAGTATLYMPSGVTGRALEVRVQFYQGSSTTTTPRLLDITVQAQYRPQVRKEWNLVLDVRDGLLLRNGHMESKADGLLAKLREWNAGAQEVVFTDPWGTAHYVLFIGQSDTEQLVRKEGGRRAEYLVKVRLAEIV